jgi:hypothetical protein
MLVTAPRALLDAPFRIRGEVPILALTSNPSMQDIHRRLILSANAARHIGLGSIGQLRPSRRDQNEKTALSGIVLMARFS